MIKISPPTLMGFFALDVSMHWTLNMQHNNDRGMNERTGKNITAWIS